MSFKPVKILWIFLWYTIDRADSKQNKILHYESILQNSRVYTHSYNQWNYFQRGCMDKWQSGDFSIQTPGACASKNYNILRRSPILECHRIKHMHLTQIQYTLFYSLYTMDLYNSVSGACESKTEKKLLQVYKYINVFYKLLYVSLLLTNACKMTMVHWQLDRK